MLRLPNGIFKPQLPDGAVHLVGGLVFDGRGFDETRAHGLKEGHFFAQVQRGLMRHRHARPAGLTKKP